MEDSIESRLNRINKEFEILAEKIDTGYNANECRNLIKLTLTLVEEHYPDEKEFINEYKHELGRVAKYYEDNYDAETRMNKVFPINAFTKRLHGFLNNLINRRLN